MGYDWFTPKRKEIKNVSWTNHKGDGQITKVVVTTDTENQIDGLFVATVTDQAHNNLSGKLPREAVGAVRLGDLVIITGGNLMNIETGVTYKIEF